MSRWVSFLMIVIVTFTALGCGSRQETGPSSTHRYIDYGYTASFQGTSDYSFDISHMGEYKVFYECYLTHYFGSELSSSATAREFRVQNVRVITQPKIGTINVSLDWQGDSKPKEIGKDYVAWTLGRVPRRCTPAV